VLRIRTVVRCVLHVVGAALRVARVKLLMALLRQRILFITLCTHFRRTP